MQDGALRERKVKNYQTRKKALNYKDLLLFLTPSALRAAVSEYHAVADGHDPPDRGHDGSHFGRPLDGRNAPFADLHARFHNCSSKNGGALAFTHSLGAPILVLKTEGKGDPSGIVGHS